MHGVDPPCFRPYPGCWHHAGQGAQGESFDQLQHASAFRGPKNAAEACAICAEDQPYQTWKLILPAKRALLVVEKEKAQLPASDCVNDARIVTQSQ